MKKIKFLSFKFLGTVLALTVMFLFTSCLNLDSDYEKQIKIDDEKIQNYLVAQSFQYQRHSSGFYYQILTANPTGTVLERNDIVKFRYSISLLNGTFIESNYASGEKPALFKLYTYSIIPEGLDYGIKMMKTGEKYRFFMPSYLAFGSYTSDDFPANSNFIIDIEVLGIMSETEMNNLQRDSLENFMAANYPTSEHFDSGLYFVDSIPGTGETPLQGQMVTIDFKRKYLDNSLIKSVTGITLTLNNGEAVQGLEEGLKLMKTGGSALLFMPSSIAFGQSVCVIPQKTREELVYDRLIGAEVKPYSILKYVVKLKSVY